MFKKVFLVIVKCWCPIILLSCCKNCSQLVINDDINKDNFLKTFSASGILESRIFFLILEFFSGHNNSLKNKYKKSLVFITGMFSISFMVQKYHMTISNDILNSAVSHIQDTACFIGNLFSKNVHIINLWQKSQHFLPGSLRVRQTPQQIHLHPCAGFQLVRIQIKQLSVHPETSRVNSEQSTKGMAWPPWYHEVCKIPSLQGKSLITVSNNRRRGFSCI